MTRHYGRACSGQRVHDAVPENWGRNVTVLGALSCQGLDALMSSEDAADAPVFRAYATEVLAPPLQAHDVVQTGQLRINGFNLPGRKGLNSVHGRS
ncbi:hypothetical protein [Pantoea sp. 18069]|uniref:hypothetical protein n=1 Tax=Pantoea sp. 18069 TaxID=2681415 RepID=UPI00135C22A8|nr:hypothetical protein [Pantoea sp. 18069]